MLHGKQLSLLQVLVLTPYANIELCGEVSIHKQLSGVVLLWLFIGDDCYEVTMPRNAYMGFLGGDVVMVWPNGDMYGHLIQRQQWSNASPGCPCMWCTDEINETLQKIG